MIGTGIATYLYLSGGLGAISYVAPYVTKLGAWSIGVATPLVGAAASIILDWIIKPITNKAMQLCCICQRDDEGYSPAPLDSNQQHSSAKVYALTAGTTQYRSTTRNLNSNDKGLGLLLSQNSSDSSKIEPNKRIETLGSRQRAGSFP